MVRAILALALLTAAASAEVSNHVCRPIDGAMCSKTFAAQGQMMPGDVVPILETPWEAAPIAITGLSIALDVSRPWYRRLWSTPRCFAFVGNSYQPDVMLWQHGTGSTTQMFGASGYFPFPGKSEPDPPHVDLHLYCSEPAEYSARLIIYYQLR